MNVANEKPRHVSTRDRYQLARLLADPDRRAWGDPGTRMTLELALEEAVPVKTQRSRCIQMNSRARLLCLDSDDTRSITLVFPEDVDLYTDGVSVLEPLGSALLGRAVGDMVECREVQQRSRFRIEAFLDGAAALETAPNSGISEREEWSDPSFIPQKTPCLRRKNAPATERPPRKALQALT